MELKYKTYNNQSPKSCPRVFFCCHKADFDKYFEEITGDIFQFQQNAAVYYHEPTDHSEQDENYWFDLSRMQLFVVPVTTNFLTEESYARQVELPFAMEQHIPILPLVQEPGLENLFNERCGNIQCINKATLLGDVTAIPYEQKMQQFLKAVLVGDELAKRIQAEFHKRIFLSYRKKDRKYAQQIMNAIHSCPTCWDIEIWYDEFLIPGEDFNQSIREKLAESMLFAMAVTPNLLENPNYVMEKEYPMAQDLKMKILPVEALATDREKLEELFEKICPSIALNDKQALEEYLVALFAQSAEEGAAVEEICSIHYFLVGLAYHSGISMEVDHEKGIALMSKASGMGLPEASKKLANVYKNGDGVAADYQKAIRYLWQYCEQLEKEAEEASVLTECVESYLELAEMYRTSGEQQMTCNILEKVLEYAKKLDAMVPDDSKKHLVARIYTELGKMVSFLSDKEEEPESRDRVFYAGLKYCEQAIEIQKLLLKKEWTTVRAIQLIESLNYYGRLCQNREERAEEGKMAHRQGFALMRSLLEMNEDPDLLEYYRVAEKMACDLSEAGYGSPANSWGLFLMGEGTHLIFNYQSTGKWLAWGGELDKAEGYFAEGIAYAKKCLEKADSIVTKHDLMYLYDDFAEFYQEHRQDKVRERECYLAAYELAKELCEKIGSDSMFSYRKVLEKKLGMA